MGVVGVEAVEAVEAVLSCDAQLAFNLNLFEAEIIKDPSQRKSDCSDLAILEDYKNCLDSFTTPE